MRVCVCVWRGGFRASCMGSNGQVRVRRAACARESSTPPHARSMALRKLSTPSAQGPGMHHLRLPAILLAHARAQHDAAQPEQPGMVPA